MGKVTDIQWADSSINLEMGCSGCELFKPGASNNHCYAAALTERYAGLKGWPESFDKPVLFLDRIDAALRWSDLTGKERPDKPWLNGMPRVVFLNDMGDSFDPALPLNWLDAVWDKIVNSPHQWLILTKRVKRMVEYFAGRCNSGKVPDNIWPGASVTGRRTEARIRRLGEINSERLWLSIEPLLSPLSYAALQGGDFVCHDCGYRGYGFDPLVSCEHCAHLYEQGFRDEDLCGELPCPKCGALASMLRCPVCRKRDGFFSTDYNEMIPKWLVLGGESGPGARPCNVGWIEDIIHRVGEIAPVFVKQLGSNPCQDFNLGQFTTDGKGSQITSPIRLKDSKGGDMSEWPEILRVRQMPDVESRPATRAAVSLPLLKVLP